jgi:hypothetical protein
VNLRGPSGVGHLISHVPISAEALRKSVKKVLSPAPLPDSFAAGYDSWHRAEGGVFTIAVREVVETIQRSVNAPAPQGQ